MASTSIGPMAGPLPSQSSDNHLDSSMMGPPPQSFAKGTSSGSHPVSRQMSDASVGSDVSYASGSDYTFMSQVSQTSGAAFAAANSALQSMKVGALSRQNSSSSVASNRSLGNSHIWSNASSQYSIKKGNTMRMLLGIEDVDEMDVEKPGARYYQKVRSKLLNKKLQVPVTLQRRRSQREMDVEFYVESEVPAPPAIDEMDTEFLGEVTLGQAASLVEHQLQYKENERLSLVRGVRLQKRFLEPLGSGSLSPMFSDGDDEYYSDNETFVTSSVFNEAMKRLEERKKSQKNNAPSEFAKRMQEEVAKGKRDLKSVPDNMLDAVLAGMDKSKDDAMNMLQEEMDDLKEDEKNEKKEIIDVDTDESGLNRILELMDPLNREWDFPMPLEVQRQARKFAKKTQMEIDLLETLRDEDIQKLEEERKEKLAKQHLKRKVTLSNVLASQALLLRRNMSMRAASSVKLKVEPDIAKNGQISEKAVTEVNKDSYTTSISAQIGGASAGVCVKPEDEDEERTHTKAKAKNVEKNKRIAEGKRGFVLLGLMEDENKKKDEVKMRPRKAPQAPPLPTRYDGRVLEVASRENRVIRKEDPLVPNTPEIGDMGRIPQVSRANVGLNAGRLWHHNLLNDIKDDLIDTIDAMAAAGAMEEADATEEEKEKPPPAQLSRKGSIPALERLTDGDLGHVELGTTDEGENKEGEERGPSEEHSDGNNTDEAPARPSL